MLEETIRKTINKFARKRVRVKIRKKPSEWYGRGFVNGKLILWIVPLKANSDKLKGMNLGKIAYLVKDEFIVNERRGNRYCPSEGFKFKELWTTLNRENPKMKGYLFGNAYSLYCPYFPIFGIKEKDIKMGHVATSPKMAVEFFEAPPELVKRIIEGNRLLAVDEDVDEYTRFALMGEQINDVNIALRETQPSDTRLKFVFKVDGKYIGIFRSNVYPVDYNYWVGFIKSPHAREAIVLDVAELENGNVLFSSSMRFKMGDVEQSFAHHKMQFQNVEAEHSFERIYTLL